MYLPESSVKVVGLRSAISAFQGSCIPTLVHAFASPPLGQYPRAQSPEPRAEALTARTYVTKSAGLE